MSAMTYLLRHPKTGVYYFRRSVPPELREAIGKREIKKSLGTKDVREAKRRAPRVSIECDRLFDQARNGASALTQADADALAARWLAGALAEDTEERAMARRRLGSVVFDEELTGQLLSDGREALAESKLDLVSAGVESILKEAGLAIPKGSESYRRLALAVLRAHVRYLERTSERQRGVWRDEELLADAVPLAVLSRPRVSTASRQGERVTAILEKWLAERQPPLKTEREWRMAFRRFTEVVGDLAVTEITKAHVRDFKDVLLQLPRAIPRKLAGKPVPVIVRALGDKPSEKLTPAAVNKQLAAVRSVLSWAVQNGYIETNPAQGVRALGPKLNREARLPYNQDDLKLIFEQSPVYRGRRSKTRRTEPGKLIIRDVYFWLPPLALFTGARLEELGQLLVSDVREEGGVSYLDINTLEEGKRLKTRGSRRKVPIHPELVRCGFLQYVEERRRGGDKHLFPELTADRLGTRTGNFSKWWGRYARAIGITDRRKVFHSFRHTFKDACRAAGISEEVHDALTGHTSATVGRSYGSGVPLEVKATAVKKLMYAALDLRRLHGAWSS